MLIQFHFIIEHANPWYDPDRFQLFRFEGILIDGSYLYVKFLQNIYDFTVDHLFIGSFLSSVFWYFGALILLKSVNILNVNINNKKTIFLFYSFLPSTILYTSIPLREPFQLFFINLTYMPLFLYITKMIKI